MISETFDTTCVEVDSCAFLGEQFPGRGLKTYETLLPSLRGTLTSDGGTDGVGPQVETQESEGNN